MYSLLDIGIFYCYVSLPEGNGSTRYIFIYVCRYTKFEVFGGDYVLYVTIRYFLYVTIYCESSVCICICDIYNICIFS